MNVTLSISATQNMTFYSPFIHFVFTWEADPAPSCPLTWDLISICEFNSCTLSLLWRVQVVQESWCPCLKHQQHFYIWNSFSHETVLADEKNLRKSKCSNTTIISITGCQRWIWISIFSIHCFHFECILHILIAKQLFITLANWFLWKCGSQFYFTVVVEQYSECNCMKPIIEPTLTHWYIQILTEPPYLFSLLLICMYLYFCFIHSLCTNFAVDGNCVAADIVWIAMGSKSQHGCTVHVPLLLPGI